MTRDARIARFLETAGYNAGNATPLAQDASFRRYFRLRGIKAGVLMDAPPPDDLRPFLHVAAHLRGVGLAVPSIIAVDVEDGLLLEEDFGDDLLSTLLDQKRGDPEALLDAAVDALVAMQRADPPTDLPDWDAAAMAQTAMGTLFDWWWPARLGAPASDAARRDVAEALDVMLAPVAAGPTCFVHRDFFAGNLFWLSGRSGSARVGIIDFQGAALGHPAYDLVSLIQDARRDISSTLQRHATQRYLGLRPELEPAAFQAAFDACAAQRHLRVACQWVRLALRDSRPQYLVHGPRTWRLLAAALDQPAAAPLATALNRWLPTAQRGNPAGMAL